MSITTVVGEMPPLPDVELVDSDGEPMESSWHRDAMNSLIEQVRYHLRERRDYFVGGNMFIYFDVERARNRDFRGPDFFYVEGVRYDPHRPYYVVWEEGGHYPNVVVELLSPRTEKEDRTTKKAIYEKIFHTREYFLYDPETQKLEGFRHNGKKYKPIKADERGWIWSEELELWLGTWSGEYQGVSGMWLRFYDAKGDVVPLFAEAERKRADAVEAELKRLKARLANGNGTRGKKK